MTTESEDKELHEQALDVSDDLATTGVDPNDQREADAPGEDEDEKPYDPQVPQATTGGAPSWVHIPEGFKFPKGRQAVFIKLRSEWTDTPWLGDELPGLEGKWRQCIVWAISVGDKKFALKRSQQDPNRIADELTKQMIRAIDGNTVTWDGSPGAGNIEQWWNQIGERCRTLVSKVFLQLHTMKREELEDFFENCIAVRTTG